MTADQRIGVEGKAPEAGRTGAFPALEAKDGKVEAPWLVCPPGGPLTGNSGCPGPPGAPARTDTRSADTQELCQD